MVYPFATDPEEEACRLEMTAEEAEAQEIALAEAMVEDEIDEEAIAEAEHLILIGDLERAIEARDRARNNWLHWAQHAKAEALNVEEQFRQANEAYYFERGKKK